MRFVDNFVTNSRGLVLSAQAAGRNFLITNSEFSGNSAQSIPTLWIETDGNYTLRNSTISGNTARGGGSTMRANVNTNTAGAIKVNIEQSTIARNTASGEEAFGFDASANQPNPGVLVPTLFGGGNAQITLTNGIFGGRTPAYTGASTVFFNVGAGVTNITSANSLLENSAGAPASVCSGTGMKCNLGSLVAPIAYNGGTAGVRTMALMAGSPAIDAGGAVPGGLTTDARGTGFPRLAGSAADMGAYESDPATTLGCTLDADGNGLTDALTDGLVLLRAMFGLTGTAVTNGTIGSGPTRGNWTAVRNYLNANCGTSFQ